MASPLNTSQAHSTASPAPAPYAERRHTRSTNICLRRRHGQLRRANGLPERRRPPSTPFDIAGALELNLDRFPTKAAMLTLLQSWLYAAEAEDLNDTRPAYAHALRVAIEIMRSADNPVQALPRLRMALG